MPTMLTRLLPAFVMMLVAACASGRDRAPASVAEPGRGPAAASKDLECVDLLRMMAGRNPLSAAVIPDDGQWLDFIHDASPKVRKKVFKLLEAPKKGVYTPGQIRRRVLELYKLFNDKPDSLDAHILQEFEKAFAEKNAIDALSELGMLRSPKIRERIGAFFKHRYTDRTLAIVFNVPAILGGHWPPYLPTLGFKITSEDASALARILETQGGDALMRELHKRYGRTAAIDYYGRWVRRSYNTIMMGVLVYTVYAEMKAKIEAEREKARELAEFLQETLAGDPDEPEDIDEALVKGIVENYKLEAEKKGTPPDQLARELEAVEAKIRASLKGLPPPT